MKKVLLACFAACAVGLTLQARPRHRPPPPHRPAPVYHRHRDHRSRWGWGVGISPWGSSISFGTRVGRHGMIGVSVPLSYPPPVRETERVVIQQPVVQPPVVIQQPVVVPQPVVREPALLPALRYEQSAPARTWVEGYWRVTRNPDGTEGARVWVPGHWE